MKPIFDPWSAAPLPKGEELQELQVQENGYWEIFRYLETPNNELALMKDKLPICGYNGGEKRKEFRSKKREKPSTAPLIRGKDILLRNNLMVGIIYYS
jgi:hypothetical protein